MDQPSIPPKYKHLIMISRQAKGAAIFAASMDGFEEILKNA